MKKCVAFCLFASVLLFSPLVSQERRLRVTADRASIYLEPDRNSTVVEVVEKGALLTLLSRERIREHWHYVSFRSGDRFITVSGFVDVSAVEELFESPARGRAKKQKESAIKEPEQPEEIVYETPLKVQVALENANVRSKPGFQSEIIHQVQAGITLLAVSRIGEWYRVELPPDEEGIIISGYIHQTLVQEIR